MNRILEKALELINISVNVSTGLTHPRDLNKTKDLFVTLFDHDIELKKTEISLWAIEHGWKQKDARELGELAQRIGEGRNVRIVNRGNWWEPDIFTKLESMARGDEEA